MEALMRHDAAGFVLQFLTFLDATPLRATCHAACDAVKDFPHWIVLSGARESVAADVAKWKACFSNAQSVLLKPTVTDESFNYLDKVLNLNLSHCKNVSEAALTKLKHVERISLRGHSSVTDNVIQSFENALFIDLSFVTTITDEAFSKPHAARLQTFLFERGSPTTTTDVLFRNMRNLKALVLNCCPQFTDAALRYLPNLEGLCIDRCLIGDAGLCTLIKLRELSANRTAVTDEGLFHCKELRTLSLIQCEGFRGTALAKLPSLQVLFASGCTNLQNFIFFNSGQTLTFLNLDGCNSEALCDAALKPLKKLKLLSLRGCSQRTLTDAAFQGMEELEALDISYCPQLSDAAIERCCNLRELGIVGNNAFTGECFLHCGGLEALTICGCFGWEDSELIQELPHLSSISSISCAMGFVF